MEKYNSNKHAYKGTEYLKMKEVFSDVKKKNRNGLRQVVEMSHGENKK